MDDHIVAVIARSISLLATKVESYPLAQDVLIERSSGLKDPAVLPTQIEKELVRLALSINNVKRLAAINTAPGILPLSPDESNDPIAAISNSGYRPETSRRGHPDKFSSCERRPSIMPFIDHSNSFGATSQHQELTTGLIPITKDEYISAGERLGASLEEQDDTPALRTELRKYKEANEAFQETLREIGEIITAVAGGDLTRKVRMDTIELDSEITTFKRTINIMMDRLQTFASEVSRVAREVGTEGLLGGQARIDGIDGTWKELTDNGM